MVVTTKTDPQDIYTKTYFTIAYLNNWTPKPTTLDMRVFGEMLNKIYELKKTITDSNKIRDIIFSKSSKDEVVATLATSYNSLMNSLTRLRKIGLIDQNNIIDPNYAFNKDKTSFNMKIQFVINKPNV